jgi:hypothetical protein
MRSSHKQQERGDSNEEARESTTLVAVNITEDEDSVADGVSRRIPNLKFERKN